MLMSQRHEHFFVLLPHFIHFILFKEEIDHKTPKMWSSRYPFPINA